MSVYYIGDMPVSDELYHHGIKGQRWGIRRYQNSDGTLTDAGKERYGRDVTKLKPKELLYQYDNTVKYGRDKRMSKAINRLNADINRTKEAKEYYTLVNELQDIRNKIESIQGKDAPLLVNGETAMRIMAAEQAMIQKGHEMSKKRLPEISKALLEDLDYDVSESGQWMPKKY